MNATEARNKARESTDPQELLDIYEQFHKSADVVKAIVNNPFCPDEIKKRYVVYALNERLPGLQLGTSGDDILSAIRKSLEAWQPVQKLAPVPELDTSDVKVMQLYDIAQKKRAVILDGPPGTSKTYLARMIARALTDNEEHRTAFVQFHASYTYEDFIEGIVPEPIDGGIIYTIEDKVFKEFCLMAKKQPSKLFVIIIDEINRADPSKVFGEVFTCLEYRGQPVRLLYSRNPFVIPSNIVVIGTMNTLDRSTTDLDFALRRRFYFFQVPPRREWLEQILTKNEVEASLREAIKEAFDRTLPIYPLGHAYFKEVETAEDIRMLWEHQLRPLLEQFFEFDPGSVRRIEQFYSPIWSPIGEDQ
jgi:5-methylcytosine-specific restriction endonuclease McrBC GTP-binding regulatory subunit McrB